MAAGPAPALPTQPQNLPPELAALIEQYVGQVRSAPQDAARHGELGLVYAANELWPEARASFETARALDGADPLWHLHAAIAQAQSGDLQSSIQSLRAGIERHPGFAPLHMRLGDLYLVRAEPAAARDCYQRAAELAPETPQPLYGLGSVAVAEGDPSSAIAPLERALALDPSYRAPRTVLGAAYRALGREPEAERELAAGEGGLKRALPDAGSLKLSVLSFGRTRARNDAQALLTQGRAREAIGLLAPLVARYPDDPRLRVTLGLAQLQEGLGEQALATLAEAVALDPSFPLSTFNLAVACLELGRAAQALQHADRVLALSPDLVPALLVRSQALVQLERLDEARATAEQALSLDARLAPAHEVLGTVAERAGRSDEAREAFLRAAELAQSDPRPWPGIFRHGLRVGDIPLAERALENLRRLDPRYKELESMAAELERARGR